ncbi:hypothetical protein NG798_27820 [Ancylothrix sp. C2]|uniref:hypothetical protein n=1 Tax=Ancylothrix sp. D3o TaxID=2953691 RepID=UPI0021BA4893|nr:hypothetical protein [Ancylothrix sp. D3o]MCT7953609.1 hypothetical protein [Ancylothrix sp. D3o]
MNPSDSQRERELNAVLGGDYLSIQESRWANQRAIDEGADMSELPYDIEPDDYYTNYGTRSSGYEEESGDNDYPPYDPDAPDDF